MDHNAANLVSPAFSISFNGKDSFSQKSLAGVPFFITLLLKGPTTQPLFLIYNRYLVKV